MEHPVLLAIRAVLLCSSFYGSLKVWKKLDANTPTMVLIWTSFIGIPLQICAMFQIWNGQSIPSVVIATIISTLSPAWIYFIVSASICLTIYTVLQWILQNLTLTMSIFFSIGSVIGIALSYACLEDWAKERDRRKMQMTQDDI